MVNTITKNNKKYYQCSNCGFYYSEKSTAEECESWCNEHNSCNMEITKKAVKI